MDLAPQVLILAAALDEELPGPRYPTSIVEAPGTPFHGLIRVRGVPILSEDFPGQHDHHPGSAFLTSVTPAWLVSALVSHRQKLREGYLAPLIIGHHGCSPHPPPQAGFFLPTHVRQVVLDGQPLVTLHADLLIRDTWFEEVMRGVYPFLSVEVHPRDFATRRAQVHALSLLSDEPPEYRYAILAPAPIAVGDDMSSPTSRVDISSPLVQHPVMASAMPLRLRGDHMPSTDLERASTLAKQLGLSGLADRLSNGHAPGVPGGGAAPVRTQMDEPTTEAPSGDQDKAILDLLADLRAAVESIETRLSKLEGGDEEPEDTEPEAGLADVPAASSSTPDAALLTMIREQETRLSTLEQEKQAAEASASQERLFAAASAVLADAGLPLATYDKALRHAAATGKEAVDALTETLKTVSATGSSIPSDPAWGITAEMASASAPIPASGPSGDVVSKYESEGNLAIAQDGFKVWAEKFKDQGISAENYVAAYVAAAGA